MIPEIFTAYYELDKEMLRESLTDLLERSNEVNSVIVVFESFKKEQKNTWGWSIDWEVIRNKSKNLTKSHSLTLEEFKEEIFIIDENGMKGVDGQ